MSTLDKVLGGLSPQQRRLLALRVMRANRGRGDARPEQGVITGEVPFIQDWFFAQGFPDPHHWNVSTLLEVRRPLDPATLAEVVARLLAHHDALRLRFVEGESGWRSFIAAPDAAVPFHHHDLSHVPGPGQAAAVESEATRYQQSLDLSGGPLLRVVLFSLGRGEPDRLLVLMHHLVSDVISLQIFMEDLHTAYGQLSAGEPVALPPKTTSFKELIEGGVAYARTRDPREDSAFWLGLPWAKAGRLPVDHECAPGQNTESSAAAVRVSLGAAETRALLKEVPRRYSMQTAALTALALACERWSGAPALIVDLAGHGRETVVPGIDLSRTVAWIAGGTRLLLDVEGAGGLGAALALVDQQIRREEAHRMTEGRLGYDSLRFHCGDAEIMKKMWSLPQAQVLFNFLAQAAPAPSARPAEPSLVRPARESKGASRNPRCVRHLLLEVTASNVGEELVFDWRYSESVHRRATIEAVAEDYLAALRSLIGHCQSFRHPRPSRTARTHTPPLP